MVYLRVVLGDWRCASTPLQKVSVSEIFQRKKKIRRLLKKKWTIITKKSQILTKIYENLQKFHETLFEIFT